MSRSLPNASPEWLLQSCPFQSTSNLSSSAHDLVSHFPEQIEVIEWELLHSFTPCYLPKHHPCSNYFCTFAYPYLFPPDLEKKVTFLQSWLLPCALAPLLPYGELLLFPSLSLAVSVFLSSLTSSPVPECMHKCSPQSKTIFLTHYPFPSIRNCQKFLVKSSC